jgi:hypothetical protein
MKNLLRLAAGLLALASAARANSPFEVQAVSSSPAFNHTQEYSSFPTLVADVITNHGNFSALASSNSFFADITFLGVSNALQVNFTDTGSPGPTAVSVTLSSPGVGNVVNLTFTGPDRPNVEEQIKDYFLKNGSTQVGNFLAAIAKQSAIAVTDGNPNSSTAQQSNSMFYGQGFTPSADMPFETASAAAADAAGGSSGGSRFYGYGIGFNSGQFTAGGIKGNVSDLSLPFGYRFTDRVSVAGNFGLNYVTISDAKIYGVGLNLGLPVRIEIMNKENPWNWRVTPLVGISARGSKDLAGGGVIWMGGLTNTVDYRVNSKLIIGMVNQITTHQSVAVKYGSTKFDPKIDQQILKNGLRAVTPITSRLIGDVFVIETNFLQDAAVESFTTFGGSLSFRLTQKFNVTLGGNYDTGDKYKSWSVGLSSAWRV